MLPIRRWIKVQVLKVYDGDTFRALTLWGPCSIRIAHIDAPEWGQPYAKQAHEKLKSLLHNKLCWVRLRKCDRYGRFVCEVKSEDHLDIAEIILANGLAWWEDSNYKVVYYGKTEREARKKRIGIWSQDNPEKPIRYRRRTQLQVTRSRGTRQG